MKRLFVSVAALVFACCTLFAQNYDRAHTLKIYNWSDYIDESLLDEFPAWYKEQTGEDVKIIYQTFDIVEVMLAKIEKGHADFDVACPTEYITQRMLKQDLLLPLYKDFENTPDYRKNVASYAREQFEKLGKHANKNASEYAVGYMWGTAGFIYNPKYVTKEEAQTITSMWNPKFDKKILIKDAFRDVYSPLLIYLYKNELESGEITMDELMCNVSDEAVAKVEQLLNQAAPLVAGWEADFGKELMTQEKGWLNWAWSGDAQWAIDEAAKVNVALAYEVPKEGSICWFDAWVIPKYAVNQKAANYFINYMCMSENVLRNMDITGYVSCVATPQILRTQSQNAVEAGFTEKIDVSYFFSPADTAVILNPIYYPDKATIEKCGLMHDSGDDSEKLLQMWTRVKGDSLDTINLIIILGLVILTITVLVIVKRNKKSKKWKK